MRGRCSLRRDLPSPVSRRYDPHLRDGRTLTERIDANRGGPANPLSARELATKFRLNLEEGGIVAATGDIINTVFGLAEIDDLEKLLALIQAPE